MNDPINKYGDLFYGIISSYKSKIQMITEKGKFSTKMKAKEVKLGNVHFYSLLGGWP